MVGARRSCAPFARRVPSAMPIPTQRRDAQRCCKGKRRWPLLWGWKARRQRIAPGLTFEELEGRTLLSTFTVTNISDTGAGSFRQAILDANSTPGANTIGFTIGSGVRTIQPTTALPAITNPVTIDGTTQRGYRGTPIIVLDGALAGAHANGLTITAGNSVVRGLV